GSAAALAAALILCLCLPVALLARRRRKRGEQEEEFRAARAESYVPHAQEELTHPVLYTEAAAFRSQVESDIQKSIAQFWDRDPHLQSNHQSFMPAAARPRSAKPPNEDVDVFSPAESDRCGSLLRANSLILRAEGGGGEDNEGGCAHEASRFQQLCQPLPAGTEEEGGAGTHNMATANPLFTAPVQQLGDEVLSDSVTASSAEAVTQKPAARLSVLSGLLAQAPAAVTKAQAAAPAMLRVGSFDQRRVEPGCNSMRVLNVAHTGDEDASSHTLGVLEPVQRRSRVSVANPHWASKACVKSRPHQLWAKAVGKAKGISRPVEPGAMQVSVQNPLYPQQESPSHRLDQGPAQPGSRTSMWLSVTNPLLAKFGVPACSDASEVGGKHKKASVFRGGIFLSEATAADTWDAWAAEGMPNPIFAGAGKRAKGSVLVTVTNPLLAKASVPVLSDAGGKHKKGSVFRGDIFLSEATAADTLDTQAASGSGRQEADAIAEATLPKSVLRTMQAIQGNARLPKADSSQVRSTLAALAELLGGDWELAARVVGDAPMLLTASAKRLQELTPALQGALSADSSSAEDALRALGGVAGRQLLDGAHAPDPAALLEALQALVETLGSAEAAIKVAGAPEVASSGRGVAETLAMLGAVLDGAEHAHAAAIESPELLGLEELDLEEVMAALEAGLGGREAAQRAARLKPKVLGAGREMIDRAAEGLRQAFLGEGHAQHAMLILTCNPAVLMARRGAVGESAAALVGALAALEGSESGAHPGERLALMAVEREPCLLLSNARDVRGAASVLAELAGDKAEALRAVGQFPSLLLAKPHAFDAATLDAIGALVGGRTAALEFLGRHSELLRCQKGVLARGAVELGKALGEAASEVAAARPAVLTLAPGAAMTVMKALEKALGGAELARQAVRENPALLEESSPKLLEGALRALVEVFGDAEVALEVARRAPSVLAVRAKDIRKAAEAVTYAVTQATGSAGHATELMRQCPEVLAAEPKTLGEVVFELLMGLAEHWDLDSDDSETGAAVRQEQPKKARGLWKKVSKQSKQSWVLQAMLAAGRSGDGEAPDGPALSEDDLQALSRMGAAECVAPLLQEVEDRMCRLQRSLTMASVDQRDAALGELGDIHADIGRLAALSVSDARPSNEDEAAQGGVFREASQEAVHMLDRLQRAQSRLGTVPEEEQAAAAKQLRPVSAAKKQEETTDMTDMIQLVRSKLKAVHRNEGPQQAHGRFGKLRKVIGIPAKNTPEGLEKISKELRDKLVHRRVAAGSIFELNTQEPDAEAAKSRWRTAAMKQLTHDKSQMEQPSRTRRMRFGRK
ncbi:hypothetical protein CYMTET_12805, partial [Cymbomonas tetramitiformis]